MHTGSEPADLREVTESAEGRRALVLGLVRAALITVAILVAYFVLPLDGLSDLGALIALPVALVAFVALVVLQVRRITRAPRPGVVAIEALATSVPVLLVIFSATYFVMGSKTPDWFTESLSRLDALYFTVTVFATVGFGDIAAVSPPARLAVTVQMVVNLLVIGIGLRLILGAVKVARQRSGQPTPGGDA
jgi:hypothetical protein